MPTASSGSLPWQRGAIFQFFASLKLAVVLLAVLIIASIAGTIYESSFDARVARAYVYGAPWFNLWLVLLGTNLTVSALSRWPWRTHHVAFLVTHLGIITLLTGSLIGRIFGIEGTVTLFKGEPPTNRLLIDEHQLRVQDTDGIIKGYRAEFLHHPPSERHPRDLGTLASGARLAVTDYASAIDATLNPLQLDSGGTAALHFVINTTMMGQRLESWLLADDPQHGNFAMGLANIELKRGRAHVASEGSNPERPKQSGNVLEKASATSQPSPSAESNPPGTSEIEESIFAFANAPDQQIGHVAKGGSSGAALFLSQPRNGDKGRLTLSLARKAQTFDVAENIGKDVAIEGTNLSARIEKYWADFRMQDGKPVSIGDAPDNPTVIVTIHGVGVPIASAPKTNRAHENISTNGGPSSMPAGPSTEANHLTLFIADDGSISYELASRKSGNSSGALGLNTPLLTGWADWQLIVDHVMPHAEQFMKFNPTKSDKGDLPEGLRIRVRQNGQTIEQWVPAGWQITFPMSPEPISISYGWRALPLPITLKLLDFEVARNEGTDAPAGFKSTLRVSTAEGQSAIGQCWMNHPFSFPGACWQTWTGLTFKISQASWNPENLDQSTVQILRDPGWSLKWIGSLLVVAGVFMMFYVKKFRRHSASSATKSIAAAPRAKREAAIAEAR